MHANLPSPGRLFYLIGPSGAGKDSLICYARKRIGGAPVRFAADIRARIARNRALPRPEHPALELIHNDGELADAGDALIDLLTRRHAVPAHTRS